MRLEVSVAGFLASWDFPGSNGFESWARERPWLTRGGMCTLRASCGQAADLFYSSVCRVLRAMHGDEKRLTIHRVECRPDLGSPIQAVLAALEVDASLSPFEAKAALMHRFLDRPTVIVISEQEPVAARGWYELALLIEHFGKSTPIVPLCVIALDSRAAVLHDPAFDFTVGRTTHLLLAEAAELEEFLVWRSYLHHRGCWEAAGDPHRAQVWGEALGQVSLGDDDEVEKTLVECAEEAAQSVSLRTLVPQILEATQRQQSPRRDAARHQLHEKQIMWRPPGLQRLELTPWASRALLRHSGVPEILIPRLRHNLVCMPIASEILAHCLNAEAKIRMQLVGKQARDPDDRTVQSFERFRQGKDDFVIYPANYPCPPSRTQDVWSFAALGETMRACKASDIADRLWETLHLRNSIAHGHYVSWIHVKRALQQLRRFDV